MLTRLRVTNFKSLKELSLPLGRFNVLVGPNGSGKTNVIDALRLLRAAHAQDVEPFLHWWGFRNAVWQGNDDLAVGLGLDGVVGDIAVSYDIAVSGAGGATRVLRERLAAEGHFEVIKEGARLVVRNDPALVERRWTQLTGSLPKDVTRDALVDAAFHTEERGLLVNGGASHDWRGDLHEVEYTTLATGTGPHQAGRGPVLVSPAMFPETNHDGSRSWHALYDRACRLGRISSFARLLHANIGLAKQPTPYRREGELQEDASNLHTVLQSIFAEAGRWPDPFVYVLGEVFPGLSLIAQPTEDGRVFLRAKENGAELNPRALPDGLYKVLAILAALHRRPPLLVIEEIENSLHERAVECVLDAIRAEGVQAIVTTHSPMVVDLTDLPDLVVLERTAEGTRAGRVPDPEAARRKLGDLGLTFSEGWLYGKLPVA